MKLKKKKVHKIWSDEKQLKKIAFLLYENYRVSESELEECKQIMESFKGHSQSVPEP